MIMRQYLSRVLAGMANGLFASLIMGTILNQVGLYLGSDLLRTVGQSAQYLMGPAIGAGVAIALSCRQFTILSAMIAGALGAGCISFDKGFALLQIGEPVGALVASWLAIVLGKKLDGRTKFDLLLVPAVMAVVAGVVGASIAPLIALLLKQVGLGINSLALLQPLPMGLLLAVVVGMLLTLPISSAALCIAIGINGLAAGAALAGCCAQMVGFAVMSYRDNNIKGLLAVGLGTSMLQVPNIIKNPWIWLPPTVTAAICGPISTLYYHMKTTAVGAGMGTSGLVGQFTTLEVMGSSAIMPIIILHFLLPAMLSLLMDAYMRKLGLIRPGDLKL